MIFFGLAVFLFLASATRAENVIPTEEQVNCVTSFITNNVEDSRVFELVTSCDLEDTSVSLVI